jgi:hypothetical protein
MRRSIKASYFFLPPSARSASPPFPAYYVVKQLLRQAYATRDVHTGGILHGQRSAMLADGWGEGLRCRGRK